MSATMAREGGSVQLEKSDMCLTLNMAKLAKGGCSHAAIEETKYLSKKALPEDQEEKICGIQFPGHKMVKPAIERHPAMLRPNPTPRYLPCQNCTTNNPQPCWRQQETSAVPPNRPRKRTPEPTAELTPSQPWTPPASTCNTSRAQHPEIVNLPAGYAYAHTSLPTAESVTLNISAQDSEHNTDFDSDMLPDEGTSTG